ncbi:hypothetical protein [Natronococcus sp. A-GB7]|uniref:Cap15 family cyclic dinucleotide receptor domain-containing protein n=1 Tax=Natronococcus sp. A-GB7 TaxID=3037649 RepID=UPI00241EAEA7|nr:hypothetical protein [Natronococcus sp. A-GB7]MDG5818118.1 hypothetical protein [Natronococcus sp. A-GB7]
MGNPVWNRIHFVRSFSLENIGNSKKPLVSTSDLSGEWEGWIETSYDGDYEIPEEALHTDNDPDSDYTRMIGNLHITQRWRKINIHFVTYTSASDSVGATILASDGRWPTLSYQYENQPDSDTPKTMSLHHGTTNLELKKDENEDDILEGFYYTGNGRRNHGKMHFKRVD